VTSDQFAADAWEILADHWSLVTDHSTLVTPPHPFTK